VFIVLAFIIIIILYYIYYITVTSHHIDFMLCYTWPYLVAHLNSVSKLTIIWIHSRIHSRVNDELYGPMNCVQMRRLLPVLHYVYCSRPMLLSHAIASYVIRIVACGRPRGIAVLFQELDSLSLPAS